MSHHQVKVQAVVFFSFSSLNFDTNVLTSDFVLLCLKDYDSFKRRGAVD